MEHIPGTALIDDDYLLEKMAGKGGWTYIVIPALPQAKRGRMGMVRVKGSIDSFELRAFNLMPMKNGKLFLPVRAEIRKEIGKKEGDWAKVTLYADEMPVEVPEELFLCLQDEPKALQNFLNYSDAEQKATVEWIYSAKKEDTKIDRIAALINRLSG